MTSLTEDEFNLFISINKLMDDDSKYQHAYVSMLHEFFYIIKQKYKFDLRDQYIGIDGLLLDRPLNLPQP